MFTIGAADWFGLPVSTTHVLSSGIAGTMAANHTGLQWGTVRNLAMAWILTLPVSMMLAGFLFWGFRNIFSRNPVLSAELAPRHSSGQGSQTRGAPGGRNPYFTAIRG